MASTSSVVGVPREEGFPLGATALALTAFAANSLLCREALSSESIDPVSFTAVRIGSGALALSLLALGRSRLRSPLDRGSRKTSLGAAALFVYALCFSLAYAYVPAATGALVLFGAVQLTMVAAAIASGERPSPLEWTGLAVAAAGLALLLAPDLGTPTIAGGALMGVAGAAWGGYTLSGRGSRDPLGANASRFRAALPLAALASLFAMPEATLTVRGLALAAASGTLASGLGYAVWYRALRRASATGAAAVQLAVPAIAAAGGALFLAEPLSLHELACGVLTLGGIGLVLTARRQPTGTV